MAALLEETDLYRSIDKQGQSNICKMNLPFITYYLNIVILPRKASPKPQTLT